MAAVQCSQLVTAAHLPVKIKDTTCRLRVNQYILKEESVREAYFASDNILFRVEKNR